jgi:hypothetical protein
MAKADEWLFTYWTLYVQEGRTYAEPYYFAEATTARRAHEHAKAFLWLPAGAGKASVTDLLARSQGKERPIADGCSQADRQVAARVPYREG